MQYLGSDDSLMPEINCDVEAINSVKESLIQLAKDGEIDSNHPILEMFIEWMDAQKMVDRYGDMTEEGRSICYRLEQRIK